jgi:hypothetical protein
MIVRAMSRGIINKLLYLCVMLAVPCAGCKPIYFPASLGAPAPPVVSQLENRKGGTNSYIGLDAGYALAMNEDERNYMARVQYVFARSGERATLNIGFSGFTGMYDVTQVPSYAKSYNYIGGGAQVGGIARMPFRKSELGVGFYSYMALEGGEFYSFRKKAKEEDLAEAIWDFAYVVVAVQPLIFNYRFSERDLMSVQLNLASSFVWTANIIYERNRSCYWLAWDPLPLLGEDVDTNRFGAFSAGVMYNFK